MSLEKLLNLTYQEDRKISPAEMQQLYAQGWLLTHYLFSSKEREGQLGRYMTDLNQGIAPKQAFQTAFKTDYAALDKELIAYFRKGKLPYIKIKPEFIKAVPIALRSLATEEADLQMLEAQLRIGIAKSDRAEFDRKFAAATDPLLSTDAGRLAQAEWEITRGDPGKVSSLLEPVLKTTPTLPRALALQAFAAYKLSAEEEEDESKHAAALKTARSWAIKANRAAPDTPLPLMLFYLSFRHDEKGPPASALAGLERAWELMPQDSYLTFLTAAAVARAGRKEDARFFLRPAMNNPHGGTVAAAARALMKLIDTSDASVIGIPLDTGEKE